MTNIIKKFVRSLLPNCETSLIDNALRGLKFGGFIILIFYIAALIWWIV